jgi:hypothetical protein
MLDLVNVALRTLMCLAFLLWVVRPMLFALSRREPNQVEIEEIVDSAVHSAFKSLGVKNPPPKMLPLPAAPVLSPDPESVPAPERSEDASDVQALAPEEATALDTSVADAAQESAETTQAPPEDTEPDPEEALRQMRERIKQEQKKAAKPTIPTELLQDANSYEDKLMVVRMLVDQEQSRVASVLKRMIKIE